MLKTKKYITEDENDDDYNDELVFIRKVLADQAKPEEYEDYNDYASTLKSESGAIKGKTLFIGSGPYPVSPIILHNFGVNVDGMDYSGEAVEISKQVLKKMNLNIPIFQADGTTYKGYGNYDTIIVALEAGNTVQLKEAILSNISTQVGSHTNILVRSSNTSMFVNVADYLINNFNIISKIPIFSGMSTTFVVNKKMVENIIKLNKKQLSETIERVINNLLIENDDQKIREHNYLVNLIKKHNSTPINKTTIRRDLFKQIQNKSKILGYSIASEGNNIIVTSNDKPIKTIGVRQSQEEINNHKTLVEYPIEFQEFVNTLFKTGGLGVHKLDIGSDPEQAQRNILQNKKTVVANMALDSLENMFNSGIIKIKTTPQEHRVPMDEYFDDIQHDDFDYAFRQMVGEGVLKEGHDEIKEINNLSNDIIDYLTEQNMKFLKDFVSGLGRSAANFNIWEFSLDHGVTDINKYTFLKSFLREFPIKIVIVKWLNNAVGVWVSYGGGDGGEINLNLREGDFIGELDWFCEQYNLRYNWNDENAYAGLRYVLNDEFKNTLVHELQHAFDDYRSGGKYSSDKKSKNYYKGLDYSPFKSNTSRTDSQDAAYYGLPHEYWARFSSYITKNFINFDRPFKDMSEDFKLWFQGYNRLGENDKKRLQKALYKYWLEENEIKKENIMILNKTKLQETVEKIVSGLLKEEIDNQLLRIVTFSGDVIDNLTSNQARNYQRRNGGSIFGMESKFDADVEKTKLDFKNTAKEQVDEATYSFTPDDPQLQQKTQKLQSDSTLFNKDEDEIKIDTTNESIITGGQFMKMVNEAKAIRDKNGDYVKAIKKADREVEYDEKGPGWNEKQKIHKNDKKYDRKSFKKSEIIEMLVTEYNAYEKRPNSIGDHTGGEARLKGASMTYDENFIAGFMTELMDNDKVKRLKEQGVPTTASLFSDNSHIMKTIYNLISRFGKRIHFESLNKGTYILCILDGGEEKTRLNPNCNFGVGYNCSEDAITKRIEKDKQTGRKVNQAKFDL